MAGAQLDNLLRHLHTLTQASGTEALSDGELVRRFAASREEAAFTALVRRHGPLVLQVCQRLLHDPHTTEDVFQATFLVLARKANSLRKPDAVGSFLYGVAYRLARRACADAARRRFHESRRPAPRPVDPLAEVSGRELLAVLEGELNRLPSKYRSPLVLCCLQGRARDEAARQLGWSLRTLQRRLERGRALLHARLSRRGLTLSAVLLSTLLVPPASSALPARLLAPTVRAALTFTARSAAPLVPPSGRAAVLAQRMLRTMFFTKLKIAAALTAALTLLTAGVCLLAQPAPAARTTEAQPASGSRSAPPPPPVAGTEAERVIRTDDAIAAGLQWLARQQTPGGHWSLDGTYKNDVAATALALLPFLEAGETHQTTGAFHPYARRVERGLRYLLRVQDDAGNFDPRMYMYSHALAALAVCEAFRRTTDPMLKKPAQRAIDFIVKAQDEAGGWRYTPGQSGDTSVTSYQVRALASARRAGLNVPEQTLTRAGKFLDSVASANGGYRYVPGAGDATPTMTAAGHLCRLELGGKPDDKKLAEGIAALREQLPLKDKSDLYYYHYVTRLLERHGGAAWDWWEPTIRKLLLDRQDRKSGRHQGSWPADGGQFASCGRLLMTSLALLSLQACARTDQLPPLPAREWKHRELADLYAALGDEDFVTARRALRTLAASPRQSVPFLRTVLRPAPPIDARRIDQLIADLDDDKFAVRVRATAELEKLGEVAHPALRKALAHKPALEARRRIEQVLEATDPDNHPAAQRKDVRAVEVLAQAGTPEARRFLEELADGAAESPLTRAAKTTLERWTKRPAP